ncbi:MAG: class D sortase [Oscillospiraceae bacterium]|nr:class D sortase [Oscillospiraceae bacterium]
METQEAQNITEAAPQKQKRSSLLMFLAGITAMAVGIGILSFYAVRRIRRDLHRKALMETNVVIEIPELSIKAPVLEGTDQSVLHEGVGHFTGTGAVGEGNYCIAGHSSTLYKEYFNNLKNVQNGMEIRLYRVDKTSEIYTVEDSFIVDPDETWILEDFDDTRVTLVTCTDDGSQRLVVVGELEKN